MKYSTKKKLVPAIAAITAISAVGGLAWLTDSDVATESQSITAGTFSIEFTDETAFTLSGANAVPMTDEAAIAAELDAGYFTVHNDGDIDQLVRLAAEDIEEYVEDSGAIASDKIKVKITKVDDEDNEVDYYLGLLSELDSANANGVTESFYLYAGESQKFAIRAWIISSAGSADLFNVVGGEGDDKDNINYNDPHTVGFKVGAYGVQLSGGINNGYWEAYVDPLFD